MVLAAVLFVVCVIVSRAVPLLYGTAYTSGADIMPVLGAAVLPWSVFTVVLAATRVRHDQGDNVILSLLFAVSILGPAVYLVVQFGIKGAAWAWLFGNCLSASAAWVVLRRLRRGAGRGEPASISEQDSLEIGLLDNREFL